MLGSFKIRMLIVIVIAALVGLVMQYDHGSRRIVEPALAYIMKDYHVEQKIGHFIDNVKRAEPETVPTSGSQTLQAPCEFISIENSYGWYWNPETKRQEFSPGITLKVKENSMVKPVLPGQIIEIKGNISDRKILIKHNGDFSSEYDGLSEVLVNEKDWVKHNTVLGKTGSRLYFQVKNQDGPLNPNDIFK